MRTSWRAGVLILLIGAWPLVGCHQLPTGTGVQDLRPIQLKDGSTPKHELTAVEVGQTLSAQAKAQDDVQKIAETVAAYEKLRTTDKSQAWYATKKLGLLYLQHNELDRAEQEFQLLWKHNPKDADTLCSLGDISYRRGHFGSAEKWFRDALSKQPDHTYALVNLGMTLAQRGQGNESVTYFKKVGLTEGEANCQVAGILKLNKKAPEALRHYQAALVSEPGNQQARAAIAQLYQEDPMLTVRATAPHKAASRGVVELEPTTAPATEDTGRLMNQRPSLPPLRDFDLGDETGRDWRSSTK